MHPLADRDHQYVWHPFTQMQDWLKTEPIVIRSGQGAVLRDVHGREYLDGNASIWTNLHGHNHPRINAAIRRQLRQIAHSSALGLANEPAALLAEQLVKLANPPVKREWPGPENTVPSGGQTATDENSSAGHADLAKVFFSDDGSTALEVALKLAYEYARRTGRSRQPRFLSLAGAYHGDTVGAVSLGHIDLFHQAYAGLLFKSETVMAPYCYRCPFNRARPERADARDYRQCRWQCVDQVEKALATAQRRQRPFAAMVVEPLIQGAAGMIAQPRGWLSQVAQRVRACGAQLIADEVMTGFGRTGFIVDKSMLSSNNTSTEFRPPGENLGIKTPRQDEPALFACHQEGVRPDFMAVAKGLTGGYLPLAATLTTQAVFDAFLGEYAEFKTFFHGHSYTANQLGSAAALASLALLQEPANIRARKKLDQTLATAAADLWKIDAVGDIRQVGLMVGVELVKDWRNRVPFAVEEQVGIRVCQAMARRGVLTRPIGNILVLMPPYCTTPKQVEKMVETMADSIRGEHTRLMI